MASSAPNLEPGVFSEHDWAEARKRLIFYFSRRSLMGAEDLAQETLTRLANRLRTKDSRIEGDDGFMKLVHGFARKVLLERIKPGHPPYEELPDEIPQTSATTRGLNSQEAGAFVRELLDRLTEPERQLFLAAQTQSPKDLAERLRIPINTLRVQLFRVRQKLREMAIGNLQGGT